MVRDSFSIKNFFLGISFGLVFVAVLGFMYLRTNVFFPINAALWKDYIQTSILFFTFIFSISSAITNQISRELFKISFFKEIWKYFLSFIISYAGFYGLFYLIQGSALPSIAQSLSGYNIGIIFLYVFLVSFPEQKIFFQIFPRALATTKAPKWVITLVIVVGFGLYHWTIGRSIYTLIIYIPLGLLFTFIRDRFSPTTNMADSGTHAAWDVILSGIIP